MKIRFAFTAAPDKRRTFPNATDDALSLLSRFLTFDPNKRITAEEVRLKHAVYTVHIRLNTLQLCALNMLR